MLHSEKIATLWLQLTEIYGKRFVNEYGEKDNGAWSLALRDITGEGINFGIEAMMRDIRFETWPPNCTQFYHLCIHADVKALPDVHKAFREARDILDSQRAKPWSHPAIKFTVKYLGIDKVNDARTYKAFTEFSAFYAKVCNRIASGHQVPYVADEELVAKPVRKSTPPRLITFIR